MRLDSRPATLLVFALCTLPLWLYGALCGSTGHDDSHITFWQADSLLQHGALLNYNGERLEQSSSLLLLLLTAAASAFNTFSTVTTGYLVNLGSAVLTLFLVWRAAHQYQHSAWLPTWLTALTSCFAYWAWSGMETSLAACCALWFLLCLHRQLNADNGASRLLLIVSAVLLALVRPEMPVVGIALLLCVSLWQRKPQLLIYSLALTLIPLWRLGYFGSFFPNPVYAKRGSPDLQQIQRGLSLARRNRKFYGAPLL